MHLQQVHMQVAANVLCTTLSGCLASYLVQPPVWLAGYAVNGMPDIYAVNGMPDIYAVNGMPDMYAVNALPWLSTCKANRQRAN